MTTSHISKGLAALGGAALLALSTAAATAAPAYVKSTVNLRSGPATSNEIVGKIPGGSLVEASNCSDWCEVTWQGKSGYAIKTALDTSGRVPARSAARATPARAPVEYDDDVPVGPLYYGPPAVVGYPYPYYRPFGYYRYRPYYAYRGGWGPRYGWRRW